MPPVTPSQPSLMCSNAACKAVGMWVDVDPAAERFARQEGIEVLCARCRRALIRIQRGQPPTTQGA